MGKYDSSKTRVTPIFDTLYANGKTGNSWLKILLNLPSGGKPVTVKNDWDFTILEKGWGENEKKLEPPVSLLSWLIRHCKTPKNGKLSADLEKTRKRQELIDESDFRIKEGLSLLRNNPAQENWFVFEGQTQPDVFIQTSDLVIVIEGKRTEPETTKHTKWMQGRHQMLRHLDCAWEIKGRKQVIGFFIVEGEGTTDDVSDFWKKEATNTINQDAIASSLPHRGPEEQTAIANCFIGITTWQRICKEFGIDWNSLPDLAA
jgi:hypothetical protein